MRWSPDSDFSMKFCADIHAPLRVNYNFSDPLTFTLVQLAGQHLNLLNTKIKDIPMSIDGTLCLALIGKCQHA